MVHALRILIVEDHLLIAKQIELIVAQAGHTVVGTAFDAPSACALAQATQPDVVFLDIGLAGGTSGLEAASAIVETGRAHVVFTTANRRRLPEGYCGAVGVVEKPFTRAGLSSALQFIAARIRASQADISLPDCLRLSPLYEARWQSSGAA